MNMNVDRRILMAAALLSAAAVFTIGFFVALGVRSVVAGPDSAPAAQAVPNPGHSWSEIGDLPGTMWHSNNDGTGSGLDADMVDGMHAGQTGTSYVPYADASGNVGIGTASPGQKLSVAGLVESISGGFKFPDGSVQTTAASGAVLDSFKTVAHNYVSVQGGTWLFMGTVQTDGAHCHNVRMYLRIDGSRVEELGRKGGCYDNGDPVQGITLWTLPPGSHTARFDYDRYDGGVSWTRFIGIRIAD